MNTQSPDLGLSDQFLPTETNMVKAAGITGTFRITYMDQRDEEFADAEVPGFTRS